MQQIAGDRFRAGDPIFLEPEPQPGATGLKLSDRELSY